MSKSIEHEIRAIGIFVQLGDGNIRYVVNSAQQQLDAVYSCRDFNGVLKVSEETFNLMSIKYQCGGTIFDQIEHDKTERRNEQK